MITTNPEFNHVSRGAYELPRLLVRLGDVSSSARLSTEQCNIAKAAEAHAYNTNETVMRGIESIGTLLRIAGVSEDGIENDCLSAIGELLVHLAVEAQQSQDVESSMRTILRAQKEVKS